jgi:hypothetical protein
MTTIQDFAHSFVWDYRAQILPAVLAAPIAIEATRLAVNVVQKPEVAASNLRRLKQVLVDSFTRAPLETSSEFRLRLVKNVLKALAALALIGAAACCPFIILPSAFAIPVAIIAIYGVGLALKQMNKLDVHAIFVRPFLREAGESDAAYRKKVLLNVGKVLCGLVLIAGAVFALMHVGALGGLIATLAKMNPWSIPSLLPTQTPLVVFLEYAAIGLLHLALAAKAFYNREKGLGCFHLFNALLSIAFPLYYFLSDPVGMRLHHSFTGLLLQLMPFNCLKLLGGMITFDSALNVFFPGRGGFDAFGHFHQYDIMNIIVENFSSFFTAYTVASAIEIANDALFAEQSKTLLAR